MGDSVSLPGPRPDQLCADAEGALAPVRVQLSRAKGWRMPPNTVRVARPGPWGNPFNLKSADHCWTALALGFRADPLGRQVASVALFRAWVLNGKPAEISGCGLFAKAEDNDSPLTVSPTIRAPRPPSLADIRAALAGRNLACWCKPGTPCHADVLLELANSPNPEDHSLSGRQGNTSEGHAPRDTSQ